MSVREERWAKPVGTRSDDERRSGHQIVETPVETSFAISLSDCYLDLLLIIFLDLRDDNAI